MRKRHLACVGALIGAWTVFSDGAAAAMPPFVATEGEWSEAADGRSLTYVGTRSLLVQLGFDLDRVRMSGLAVRLKTDAEEVVIVVGRERVRVDLAGREDDEAELSLGRAGTTEGVRVGENESPAARAGWLRILGGMEPSGVLEFPRATYVIVEDGVEASTRNPVDEQADEGGVEESGEDDGDEEIGEEAADDEARAAGDRLTPKFVDGVPRIELVWDEPATRVYEASQRLRGAFKCQTCSGTREVYDSVEVRRQRTRTMSRPQMRRVLRPCAACDVTGYRDGRSDRQFMDTFIDRLVRADPEHPRYERGVDEQWPEVLRAILEINPGATSVVNKAAFERMRDAESQEIGTPIWFVAECNFDKPVWLEEREGRLRECVSVYFPEARMIVLVTEPRIEQAITGRYCMVGGALAGFAFPDVAGAGVVPVLQGGFIVGR